jgi:hypothetical protein
MFGKIENGIFVRAPFRMSESEAIRNGYKPVVLTPPPSYDDDHDAVEYLEEKEDSIVRHWNIVELPPVQDDELTDDEALAIILGGAT